MFGYIKPYVPELRIRENETYKAMYCGLCRSMKAHTGILSTLALSYDYVFLASVRALVLGEELHARRRRCAAHPLRSRAMIDDSPSIAYAAYISALMTYYKLGDDKNDESGLKRLRASLFLPFSASAKSRLKGFDDLEASVRSSLGKLAELEASSSDSIDSTAETFGSLLGNIFAFGIDGANGRVLYELGFHVGKYVYIADAADDAADDKKKHRYNPILAAYKDDALTQKTLTLPSGKKAVRTVVSDRASSDIMRAALLELDNAGKALDLLDLSASPTLGGIIKNIVYLGIPKELDRILSGMPQMSDRNLTSI